MGSYLSDNGGQDFSTQQGKRNWFYMEKDADQYKNLIWDENQQKWASKGSRLYIFAVL